MLLHLAFHGIYIKAFSRSTCSGAQSEDGSVQTSQEGQELDPRDSEAHRGVGFDNPEGQEIFNLTQSIKVFLVQY